jgi:predicted metal-dependent peptidase
VDFPDRFSKSRLKLLKYHPFWGQLAMRLKLKRDDSCGQGTTAVDRHGNFIYNKEWVDNLSDEDLVFEIAHEIGHLFTRTIERFPAGGMWQVWNKASDIVIDILLRDSGIAASKVSLNCTTQDLIDEYRGKCTVEVYHDLLKKNPPKKGGNGNGKGDGICTDDERKCCGGTSVEQGATKEDIVKWQQVVVSAAEAAKSRGKLPGMLSDWITNILEPKVKWTDYLRLKTQQIMKRKWTWRTSGRRGEALNIRLPGKHPKLPTAVCAIDTSGSVSNDQITRFLSECSEILRLTGGKMRVLLFDHGVYFDEEVEDFQSDVVQMQRGGTDFQKVFEHLDEEKPNMLVFFTDLYAPYPTEHPGYPVIWALTPQHNTDPVPFGETVVVEE